MCLTVKDVGNGIQTATDPIKVWKLLCIKDNQSPYLHRRYMPNQTAHTDRKLIIDQTQFGSATDYVVEHGLHAYTNYERTMCVLRASAFIDPAYKVVSMTIPKGAKYVMGLHQTIVANKMETGSLEAL